MDYGQLGRTGLRVSRLGFGTGALPEAGAPRAGARVLVEAARCGVTFWDTANNYDTYREIRLALKRLGTRYPGIVISSKVEAHSASGASRQIQRALREIGREWIDVMVLHYVREPLGRWAGALAVLRRAKRRGDVWAIGLSTHHPRHVLAAIEERLDAVFVTLNVAGTWTEGPDGREGMVRACRQAARAGLGVVILKVLGNGALCSQKARALRWAARYPHADAVLVGMASVDELRENLTYFR